MPLDGTRGSGALHKNPTFHDRKHDCRICIMWCKVLTEQIMSGFLTRVRVFLLKVAVCTLCDFGCHQKSAAEACEAIGNWSPLKSQLFCLQSYLKYLARYETWFYFYLYKSHCRAIPGNFDQWIAYALSVRYKIRCTFTQSVLGKSSMNPCYNLFFQSDLASNRLTNPNFRLETRGTISGERKTWGSVPFPEIVYSLRLPLPFPSLYHSNNASPETTY